MDTTESLYEGHYLRLKKRGNWEYAERTHAGSAVIIIAVTPEENLLFVEQYRVPMNANTIEMPAGLVGDQDENDTFESAAVRELLEETGWQADEVQINARAQRKGQASRGRGSRRGILPLGGKGQKEEGDPCCAANMHGAAPSNGCRALIPGDRAGELFGRPSAPIEKANPRLII